MDYLPRGIDRPDRDVLSLTRWAKQADLRASDHIARASSPDRLDGAFFLGRSEAGDYLGVHDDRHVVTVAGSRAGKGVSAIIPNLVLWPGSVVVTDPKGENAALTAARRKARGQPVAVLDPFDASKAPDKARFNPLDLIDPEARSSVDDAGLIADALIVQEEGSGQHFTMSARNLLQGMILYVASYKQGSERTLATVRSLLAGDPDTRETALDEMKAKAENPKFPGDPVLAMAAHAFDGKPDNERGSVLSTAVEQTAFLSAPDMAEALGRSTFDMKALRSKNGLALYLCLPARYMGTHARFLRLMVTAAIATVESLGRFDPAKERRILAVLDEFAALQHLDVIETAAGFMAGFGLKLWAVLQDLTQLQRHYRQSWETFLGNAGVLQAFGNTDKTTLDYLSHQLGQTVMLSENISASMRRDSASRSESIQAVPLLRSDEIRQIYARDPNGGGRQMVIIPDLPPISAQRVPWIADRHLKSLVSA